MVEQLILAERAKGLVLLTCVARPLDVEILVSSLPNCCTEGEGIAVLLSLVLKPAGSIGAF